MQQNSASVTTGATAPHASAGAAPPPRASSPLREAAKSAWYTVAPWLFGNPLATAVRDRSIAAYLAGADLPRVNVGAGKYPMPGWLNFDLVPRQRGVFHADATRSMPLAAGSIALLRSEHMIEHLPYGAGLAFLRESFRVLRPGGRIRLITPDMEKILALREEQADPVATSYVEWVTRQKYPEAAGPDPAFAINAMFRFYGHQFIYTRKLLQQAVERAGFRDAAFLEVGESPEPKLAGLESHGTFIGEPFNRLESMVIEAVKPG
jgi:SAM-dependent methyltransferase